MEGQKLKSLADGVFKVLHQKDIWKLTQISQPKGEDYGRPDPENQFIKRCFLGMTMAQCTCLQ